MELLEAVFVFAGWNYRIFNSAAGNFVYHGVVFCIIAFVAIIALIIKNLIYHDPTPGWPSMVCIILLVSGVQLFCLGIVGQYLSKTYLEVKKRPIYLVKEEL